MLTVIKSCRHCVIKSYLFNVYIGTDRNPISTLAANTVGLNCNPVVVQNLYPGDYYPTAGNATQCNVPLSLEQVKAIDNGADIRVVVADYDYGDDNSFYENAWGYGVIFEIDDGVADGDERTDLHLLPTINTLLTGDETYQDLLDLYFEMTLEECGEVACRLTGIRTPEYDANHEIRGWNWHNIGALSWWTIYLDQFEENMAPFHELRAAPESRMLLRFDEDSDGNLYSDRAERAANPDPVTEGETTNLQSQISNPGPLPAHNAIAAFYLGDPDAGGTLIGSQYFPTLAVGETVTATVLWDTTGITGTQTITVRVDPLGQLAETDETNNTASAPVTVLTRPDLSIPALTLSTAEIRAGDVLTITVDVHNSGQTDAGVSTLALYANEGLLASQPVTVTAGVTETVTFSWIPDTLGGVLLCGARATPLTLRGALRTYRRRM